MDQFRTPIRIEPGIPITHSMKLFTAGSCFADLLGEKFASSRFTAAINPFGTSYNPISIHRSLMTALKAERPAPELYVQSEGSFRHLNFHSSFRAKTLSQLSGLLQEKISSAGSALRNAHVLFITYGTSWIFRHRDTGQIIANCHKLHAKEFERLLLDPAEIVTSFGELYQVLRQISPAIRVILTVSPVRHLRDQHDMNQLSKAGLIIACHRITRQHMDTEYFPAYEIMMDDLRDYRFYDRDMIHPSPAAIDYIWEKFCERYFSDATRQVAARCQELSKALLHKPFDAASPDYREFLVRTIQLAKDVSTQADVTGDIKVLESRLNSFTQSK